MPKDSGGNTLTIYNWGDYVDPELLEQFEKETGITVIYQTFDSNEAMLTKVEQGGTTFDVVVPSDYAIAKMREEKLLLPLDHSKLPNLANIGSKFMDLSFDPGNLYSVPYFWGTVGIIYNPEMTEGIDFSSWNSLWDKRLDNNIFLVDGAREVMGMALNSLHYSLNDKNEEHLQEALTKLNRLSPNVKAIVGDEIKMLLANEEAAVGIVWSGDASEIMDENDKLDYVVPEEGSNIWFDNMVIPRGQPISKARISSSTSCSARMWRRRIRNTSATPRRTHLPWSCCRRKSPATTRFYPPVEITDRLEVYDNLGKRMLAHYNELFLKFKMNKK
jgi:spermidine/putrescine transport system substrate-binding protein